VGLGGRYQNYAGIKTADYFASTVASLDVLGLGYLYGLSNF
jgi:hypothetical protein